MADKYKLIHPVKYYRDHINKNIRPDGREFDKFRPVAINTGSIGTADGSAVVKLGNTNVICGIRAELAKPKSETPDCGFLCPKVDLPSFACAKYRTQTGSTNDDAPVYTKCLYDILTNSGCIDLKDLCIHKEKLAWVLYCEVICLDNDGSFVDAALIACVAALKNLKLPKVDYTSEINEIIVDSKIRSPINVKSLPVATTYMIFDNTFLITDPMEEEENLANTMLTVAVCNGEVCYVHKPGGSPIDKTQMEQCVKLALKRETHIISLLSTDLSQ